MNQVLGNVNSSIIPVAIYAKRGIIIIIIIMSLESVSASEDFIWGTRSRYQDTVDKFKLLCHGVYPGLS